MLLADTGRLISEDPIDILDAGMRFRPARLKGCPVKAFALLVAVSTCVGLILRGTISVAADVPPGVFTLDHATIGITTLDDVQKVYGMAEPSRVSPGDSADIAICYVHESRKGTTFVVFESGVMGGFKEITGFRLSARRGSSHCASTKIDVNSLATENGVHLGQGIEDFQKAIPIKFKRRGPEFRYEGNSQRAATQEELKRLRAAWPNERQDYFDVTTSVRATFNANGLVDFCVRKIESY